MQQKPEFRAWIGFHPKNLMAALLAYLGVSFHFFGILQQTVHINKADYIVGFAFYIRLCQFCHVRNVGMLGKIGRHLEGIAAGDAERVEVEPLRLAFTYDCYTFLYCHILILLI